MTFDEWYGSNRAIADSENTDLHVNRPVYAIHFANVKEL